jgi:uncharacterized membrane protein YqhA
MNSDDKSPQESSLGSQSFLERVFEGFLWSTRWLTMSAVIFGLLGSLILFVVASVDIVAVFMKVIKVYMGSVEIKDFHEMVVGKIIGAVDLYLIAIVMLIFSFGTYELFISNIEASDGKVGSKILTITSLDQLKDKLAKVIIMVLVVVFFKKAMYIEYNEALDLVYLGGSIMAICLGLYYLGKVGK